MNSVRSEGLDGASAAVLQRFAKRVVLITGAGAGQGAEEARRFVAEGAEVIVADVDEARCASVAEMVGAGAHPHRLDVSSEDEWSVLADWIRERFGRLDVLVNNAGITLRASLLSTSGDDWDRVMAVNLRGPFLGIRALADLLKLSDAPAVVNIGSSAGMTGSPAAAYSASKWGLRGLTRAAALEFAPHIRVNAVHPGGVATSMVPGDSTFDDVMSAATPAGRLASTGDVADLVLFLSSTQAGYITGSDFSVDGGLAGLGAYYSVAQRSGILLSDSPR